MMNVKYVFAEYRDKFGYGTDKIFDSKEEAIKFAENKWNRLSFRDKKSYLNDPCGTFMVYAVDMTDEEIEDYYSGDLELPLTEYQLEVCEMQFCHSIIENYRNLENTIDKDDIEL